MTEQHDVADLAGHNSVEGYSVMPPCCADERTYHESLASLVDGECARCGTEWSVRLVRESDEQDDETPPVRCEECGGPVDVTVRPGGPTTGPTLLFECSTCGWDRSAQYVGE